jgi:hypothetical protein
MNTGATHCNHFGVSRRIMAGYRNIPAFRDTPIIFDHESADRNFTLLLGPLRQSDGMTHPFFIRRPAYSHSMVAGGLPDIS